MKDVKLTLTEPTTPLIFTRNPVGLFEQMKNPEFVKEYDLIQPELKRIREKINQNDDIESYKSEKTML